MARSKPGTAWIANRRIYINAEGEPVGEKDPTRVSLLVGEGNPLPMEEALRLGLVDREGASVSVLEQAGLISEEEADVERFKDRARRSNANVGEGARLTEAPSDNTPDNMTGETASPVIAGDTKTPAQRMGEDGKADASGSASNPATTTTDISRLTWGAEGTPNAGKVREPGKAYREPTEAEVAAFNAAQAQADNAGADSGENVGNSNAPGVKPSGVEG